MIPFYPHKKKDTASQIRELGDKEELLDNLN